MSDISDAKEGEVSPNQNKERQVVSTREETMSVLLAKATKGNSLYKPTSQQVDQIIAQRGKAMDYTHEDIGKEFTKHKFDSVRESIHFLLVVIVFCLIIFVKPEFTSQAITLVAGFLAGLGYGNHLKKKSEQDE
jgi:hypothetical protein